MPHEGMLRPTGQHKLGCCIGSGSRLGCNTTVLPGRVLPPGTCTHPGSVYRG